jgi:phage tail sheath protein FI
MPVTPTYPGVYIEEIQSPVHTIIGVETAITAFVGPAPQGPDSTDLTEPAVPIGSPLQFERKFGRLDASPLGMAVDLFFQNGGSHALIVRVTNGKLTTATLTLPRGRSGTPPKLAALGKGAYGRQYRARVDFGAPANGQTTYNLTLRDIAPHGRTERYAAVSTDPKSPRTLARLLQTSNLATVVSDPLGMPDKHADVPQGVDPFTLSLSGAPLPPPPSPSPRSPTDTDGPPAAPPPPTTRPPATAPPYAPFELEGNLQDQIDEATGLDRDPVDPDDYAPASQDSGIYALTAHNAFFNMLVMVPPAGMTDLRTATLARAARIAFDKRAFMVLDPPRDWSDADKALNGRDAFLAEFDQQSLRNTALYFPRLKLDELPHTAPNQAIDVTSFPPAAAIAGLYAKTDLERGVWKAPAGLTTRIGGTLGLTQVLTDFDSGQLNPVAINALRTLPVIGSVVWGARTLVGSDLEASDYKYIPVRRLALYIEESLYRGTQWVVFEPNDEPLWSQIRLNVGAFMHTLFRQGAFQGNTPRDAYFVKCDDDTNPQADIDRGIVTIIVGFAPLKPAEFVIIQLQQFSPQLEV